MLTLWHITGWMLLLLFFSAGEASSAVADPFPEAAASYIVEVNGKTLWAHKPHLRLPPASLTKIMTALLVFEKGRMEDIVTVSRDATLATGTRLGLRTEEKMRVSYLLSATILQSANDACRLLAEYVSGSQSDFVRLMNLRARELGMSNTHFTNACGHDNPDHYSTAHDLLVLAGTAMNNLLFAELTGIVATRIDTVDKGRTFYLENKNELIGRYTGALGVKTGFTAAAGKCLIALAERKGKRVLLVMLNAPERWWHAEKILDRAFTR
jgi:serine-type D-Ala-D-Ala carboxypeptidase (penicillin-binding protein 5/6)